MTSVVTTDYGTIEIEHCPAWCKDHLDYVDENQGLLTAADASTHRRHGADVVLDEIRKPNGSEVTRDGGPRWEITAVQRMREPFTGYVGYETPPLIELLVADSGLGLTPAFIEMTTGEARVMAAHLLRLCDTVDFGEHGA